MSVLTGRELAQIARDTEQGLATNAIEVEFPFAFGTVKATVVPQRIGDDVVIDTEVDTPDGRVRLTGSTDVATFKRLVERAETAQLFHKVKNWLTRAGGYPVIRRTFVEPEFFAHSRLLSR